MKLGENLPLGHDALLFPTSGTGSFDLPHPLFKVGGLSPTTFTEASRVKSRVSKGKNVFFKIVKM